MFGLEGTASIDFRGQVIAAINETDHGVDDKLALIAVLPLQITEGYLGACKSIVESNDSIADKLKLLRATFLGIAQLPAYRIGVEESLQRESEDDAVQEREVRLLVNLFGDTTRTTRLVEEVERALPGCRTTPAANGEGFSLRVGAKRRDEAMALTEAILTRHGFYASRSKDAPSAGSSPIKSFVHGRAGPASAAER